ncbi:MAG: hypothetical protein KKA42_09475 [candidate division Zixibacteria bacterium]|nr:hypothetical protein [candidate division Zixibacteria bacterium]
MVRTLLATGVLAVCVLFLAGCGVPPASGNEATLSYDPDQKIEADAYQFSARVWRDGKPTTFRLELYVADTVIGVSGYGYLGKGALKARVIRDSLEAYFPTTKEYQFEPLDDLISSGDCPMTGSELDLQQLLRDLPDSLGYADLKVVLTDSADDRRDYSVSDDRCGWLLDLTYRLEDSGWRISYFEFTDGDEFRLRGDRQRYRDAARVKIGRFLVPSPDPAVSVTP